MTIMTETPKDASPSSDRAARLREALRENLKRRKSQLRGRAALAPADAESAPAAAPQAEQGDEARR